MSHSQESASPQARLTSALASPSRVGESRSRVGESRRNEGVGKKSRRSGRRSLSAGDLLGHPTHPLLIGPPHRVVRGRVRGEDDTPEAGIEAAAHRCFGKVPAHGVLAAATSRSANTASPGSEASTNSPLGPIAASFFSCAMRDHLHPHGMKPGRSRRGPHTKFRTVPARWLWAQCWLGAWVAREEHRAEVMARRWKPAREHGISCTSSSDQLGQDGPELGRQREPGRR